MTEEKPPCSSNFPVYSVCWSILEFFYLLKCYVLGFLVILTSNVRSQQKITPTPLNHCKIVDLFLHNPSLRFKTNTQPPGTTYILYDVNLVEGFNLRRDVYIRIAVFIKYLRQKPGYERTKLVLPPFSELYHWRSRNVDQMHLFWNQFFDLDSLKLYTDVIDMWEFFEEIAPGLGGRDELIIDEVYKLKHFQDMFENGIFVDKFEKSKCGQSDLGQGNYLQYSNITAKRVICVNFQGSAHLLQEVIEKFKPR